MSVRKEKKTQKVLNLDIMNKKKLVVLRGAGLDKESGIETFRSGENSTWNNYKVEEVATKDAWRKNKELVLDFYNKRRSQLKDVEPNEAHYSLVSLEKYYDVTHITQNVSDLLERAGSNKVLHLHGELTKVRSSLDETLVYDWHEDCNIGDKCEKGSQLRPHIVWFGEMVPKLSEAADLVYDADILIIVGTSFTVYPAASLMEHSKGDTKIYIVDPMERPLYGFIDSTYVDGVGTFGRFTHYRLPATVGMKMLEDKLKSELYVEEK
jgi:NAD-dependent deacetylase